MPKMLKQKESPKERASWTSLVEELANEIEGWAKKRRWAIHRESKTVSEEKLGEYSVPVVSILAPVGTVQIDPVARYVAGADGRVDLLAWPSMTRMLLIRKGKQWVLKTDSGVDWPQPWNEQTFATLINRLHSAA